jgi:hypothetical protein
LAGIDGWRLGELSSVERYAHVVPNEPWSRSTWMNRVASDQFSDSVSCNFFCGLRARNSAPGRINGRFCSGYGSIQLARRWCFCQARWQALPPGGPALT